MRRVDQGSQSRARFPAEKVAGVVLNREDCRVQAARIGPATRAIVERLLAHRPEDRLKVAGRLLRLGTTYGTARLEHACARAEAFGEGEYVAVKRILAGEHDHEPLPPAVRAPATEAPRVFTFMRPVGELVAALMGGLG